MSYTSTSFGGAYLFMPSGPAAVIGREGGQPTVVVRGPLSQQVRTGWTSTLTRVATLGVWDAHLRTDHTLNLQVLYAAAAAAAAVLAAAVASAPVGPRACLAMPACVPPSVLLPGLCLL